MRSHYQNKPALLVTHPVFHRAAFGAHHPLSTSRQGAVIDLCHAMGWLPPETLRQADLAVIETLSRFHTADYLHALERSCVAMLATPEVRQRYNIGTMECPLFVGLWERARATVGGSMLAAELALEGHVVFHPGGGTHHGRPGRASGFCYLNDPVFAILRFLDAGVDRVLYVDLDAHHGDGVEAAFADDARVLCVSIHEQGRWPGTGQTGMCNGGRAINFALPRLTNDAEFLFLIEALSECHVRRFTPDAVVITCGADTLKGDPLSSMALSNVGVWRAVEMCAGLARHAVVLGGGGYNPWTTVRAWAGLWARMSGQSIPSALPPAAQAILARLSSDLIDDDDRLPEWTQKIADMPDCGAIRPEIAALIDAALAKHT